MNNILKISYDPNTEFCALKYKYNRRFTDFIRYGVKPLSYRRWDNTAKIWLVHISQLPLVVTFGRKHFNFVDYSDLPEKIQIELVSRIGTICEKVTVQAPSPYNVLHLLPTAPYELVKAAYKVLCFQHHPDHGGDADMFMEIQEAFKDIESQLNQ